MVPLSQFLAVLVACFLLVHTSPLQADTAYAQLSSMLDQIPTSAAGTPVIMEIVHELKNVELNAKKDGVIAKEAGYYFILASAQIGSLRQNALGVLDLWFVINGEMIVNSNAQESLGKIKWTGLIISQQMVYLNAGDTLSLYFSTSKPKLGLVHLCPENEPAIPSFLFSMFKIKSKSTSEKEMK